MHGFITERLDDLLAEQEAPCISLYQPTHRHHPDNQQDPIRYRNLLEAAAASLGRKFPGRQLQPLLESFEALAHDSEFWNYRTEGLAVLGSPERFQIFDLPRSVPERVVVANSFHLKPLLRIAQSADRYQVLCFSREWARLYEGNRNALEPVALRDTPSTLAEALGTELSEPHQTVASYGGRADHPRAPHGEPAMYHGHGGKKDELDKDTIRFFRVLDQGILTHHSRPTGLPLLLAALPEYHTPFRRISRNPYLLDGGIAKNPDALDVRELRTEAWETVVATYLGRLDRLIGEYRAAQSRQLASDSLEQIAKAAREGRVETLLVDADREVPGRLHSETGGIQQGEMIDPEVDDLLDDLAEATLRMKGQVIVVPTDRMPTTGGAAATYRF